MYALIIVAALGVAGTATAWTVGQGMGDARGYKRATTEGDLKLATVNNNHLVALTKANDAAADLAKQLQLKVDEREAIAHKAKQDTARIAAELSRTRTERDGLRDSLEAALAPGGEQAIGDSLTACRGRAVAAGRLLEDGMRVQEALASRAESCGIDVRSLREAWPRTAEPTSSVGAEVTGE
jgi:hypothetical protein